MLRLALFGGTFDPIHNAHLTVAREAADEFRLDRVLFVPAAHPPHKPDFDRRRVRRPLSAWSRSPARPRPASCPSRLEEGAGKSYSITTIEKLWSPQATLYFIIGADAFAEIQTWHRWQDVIRLTDFIVVTRPGHRIQLRHRGRGSTRWNRGPSRVLF